MSEWEKMSKSKHNGVDPLLVVDKHGCDLTRWMMLSEAAPSAERLWSEENLPNLKNIQVRFLVL